jgi:hypothetical protein
MATTFLTLVNDTLKRLNEVQLTSDEFPTAIGFHASVKDAVNIALEEIGQEQFGFPFNHQTGSLTLVAGTSTYSAPSDMKVVDWDSFRIVKDEAENIGAVRLRQINYDTYIQRFYIRDGNAGTEDYDTPIYVYRTLGNEIAFSPIPDKAYTINYDYYQYQTTLTNATDTMSVPDQFKNVVIDGAMYHCYMFRDNSQQATIAQQRFTRGIENMRKILVNNFTDLRDTRVNRLINVPAGSK